MKNNLGTFIGMIACISVFLNFESHAADQGSAPKTGANDPDRILKFLEESEPEIRLSEEEETAHVERVRKIYELEKQKTIVEPSGAANGVVDISSPDESAEDKVLERLIEAIEMLQMEIKDLRTTINRQNPALGYNEKKPDGIERPIPSSTLP